MKRSHVYNLAACALLSSLMVASSSRADNLALQQGAEIRVNGYGVGVPYQGARTAFLAESDPNLTTDQLAGIPRYGGGGLFEMAPTAPGDDRQLLIAFDEFVGPDFWQIPPGAIITSAVLQLPFQPHVPLTRNEGFLPFELLEPWDPATATWNNFGSLPNNGVAAPGEALPLPPQPLVSPVVQLDLTPLVQLWVDTGDSSRGLALMVEGFSGSFPDEPLPLQGPDFRLPDALLGGLPVHVPSGQWGIRQPAAPFFTLSNPKLLGSRDLVSPALLITFDLPQQVIPQSPDVILPDDPTLPAQLLWQAYPGMDFELQTSQTLQPGGWQPAPMKPVEFAPGQFVGNFPIPQGGPRPVRQFGLVLTKDNDGDGLFDNRSGASEDAAGRENCGENGLAPLFQHIERLGRLLQAADNEKERNAIIAEIRTVQALYEFAKRYHDGQWGVPFFKAIEAILNGKKPNLGPRSGVNRMKIIKDALDYLNFLLWWQLTYDDSLQGASNQAKFDNVWTLYQQLRDEVQNLCQAIMNNDEALFNQILCDQVLPKIQNALNGQNVDGTPGAGSIVLKRLVKLLVEKGVNGLWELVLSQTIGKGFVNGTFKVVGRALDAIMSILNGILAFVADSQLEEARKQFNLALCKLHEEGMKLEKFHLVDDGVDLFQVTHPEDPEIRMKTTTVKPLAFVWKPTPGGDPGEGVWERRQLTIDTDADPDPTEVTFTGSGDKDPDRPGRFHEFIVNLPDIEPGEKAYVVYQVTRKWCTPDGTMVVETWNYFRGVIVNN